MKKEKQTNKVISGFKAFDKNLKCLNLQYEVGKKYSIDKDKILKCCSDINKNEAGLHFCENPMDLFNYYSPSESRVESLSVEYQNKLRYFC